MFEAFIGEKARWVLDHVSAEDTDALERCITELENDPFPPSARRTPLVKPGQRTIPDAYHCGNWAIAFHVEDVFVVIDDIGYAWPPPR